MIPILTKHDHRKIVGSLDFIDGQLIAYFPEESRATINTVFDAFGGAGIRILEEWQIEHEFFVKRVKILEFSVTEGR